MAITGLRVRIIPNTMTLHFHEDEANHGGGESAETAEDSNSMAWVDGERSRMEMFHHRPEIDEKLASEFPHLSSEERAELISFFEENGAGSGLSYNKIEQIREEAIRETKIFFARGWSVLIEYQKRQTDDVNLIRMSTRAMAMVQGFSDEAGAKTQMELAKSCGLGKVLGNNGKAAVNKTVDLFCKDKMHLPPMAGQRNGKARKEMEEARLAQLTKTKS